MNAASTELTAERIAQLRDRVARRFYDQPVVIEGLARALLDDVVSPAMASFHHGQRADRRRIRVHWAPARIFPDR